MIEDFRDLGEERDIQADPCIVGGGAAGIAMAREFAGGRHRVCLLESGDLDLEAETRHLYHGENLAFPSDSLDAGRLRYFGGLLADRDTNTADHRVLDLDGGTAWQAAAPLPSPRGHFGAVALDGRVWSVGGRVRHDTDPGDVDLVHAWDPGTGEWAAMPSLPSPRSHMEPGIFVHDRRLHIVGGIDKADAEAPRPFASTLVFDPDTGIWSAGPRLPVGLMAPAAALIGDRLYVSGGNDIMASGSQQRVTIYTVLE